MNRIAAPTPAATRWWREMWNHPMTAAAAIVIAAGLA